MNRCLLTAFLASLFLVSGIAHAEKQPQTENEKFSYAVGVQLGQNVVHQAIKIDNESFLQGISDTINQQGLKLSLEEMQQALVKYRDEEIKRQEQAAIDNKKAGEEFLSENKKDKDVVELASGLQYKIIKQGDGEKPKLADNITVHYRGTLINGTEFDSSYKRGKPVSLKLANVIKGWQEALPLMPVGSKWRLFIPPDLAYGDKAAGPDIGPNSTLLFDIELLSIN